MNSSFQVFTRGSRPVSTPAEEHSKTVLLVGPRSSAKLTYGMSIGFDLLISGFAQRGLPYLVIDRTKGMVGRTVGAMSFGGTIATVRMLASYFHKLLYAQIVYLTIGTSRA